MQSNQTTKPMILVVSKVTFELWVEGATVVVILGKSFIKLNMPGLQAFSVSKTGNS